MVTSARRRAIVENDLVPFGTLDSGLSFKTSGFFSSAFSSRSKTYKSRVNKALLAHKSINGMIYL